MPLGFSLRLVHWNAEVFYRAMIHYAMGGLLLHSGDSFLDSGFLYIDDSLCGFG